MTVAIIIAAATGVLIAGILWRLPALLAWMERE